MRRTGIIHHNAQTLQLLNFFKKSSMKITYKMLVLAVLALGLWSCQDEDLVRHPEFLEGANMRIVVSTTNKSLKLATAGSKVDFDAYSINKNLSNVEFRGFYLSGKDTLAKNKLIYSLPASGFTNGKASGSIGLDAVTKGFGLDASKFKANDVILLYTYVTLNDNRVIGWENLAASIRQGTNSSFTASWTFKIEP
jgi:hypothetical protein